MLGILREKQKNWNTVYCNVTRFKKAELNINSLAPCESFRK